MPLPTSQARVVSRTLRSGVYPIAISRVHPRPTPWLPRPFTTSSALRRHDVSKARNHYETLNVAYDATPAEIKKSFYSLSKSYHPDRNPGDASTVAKFHSISEAYSVLGTPAKRAAYDRDVISRHHPHGANAQRRGSYHSSGPAGGRPASGLSRRKTQFRGPPPSFHRSGGWGAHSAKRSAAHDESTGGGSAGPNEHGHPGANPGASGWAAGPKAGMGPGQDPFGHTLESEPAHFDRASHRRTQQAQDHRRTARILRESGATGGQESMVGMFFAVSGVLFLTFFLPFVFLGGLKRDKTLDNVEVKTKKKRASTA